MAPKKGKGTAGALSFVAFTRLIRATKLALDRHLEDFAERLRVAPLSSTLIASMTRLVEADYATFLKSVEPYVEADSLLKASQKTNCRLRSSKCGTYTDR
uniref:Uncharacterized protein n=1 Tax=Rhodnius prolixus TaxID=13249 RepID=T1IBU4_RHOPR